MENRFTQGNTRTRIYKYEQHPAWCYDLRHLWGVPLNTVLPEQERSILLYKHSTVVAQIRQRLVQSHERSTPPDQTKTKGPTKYPGVATISQGQVNIRSSFGHFAVAGAEAVVTPVIDVGRRLDTHSYVMKVIAWPGIMRMSLGVSPFHRALTPSSLAMRVMDGTKPSYFGACPGIITCQCDKSRFSEVAKAGGAEVRSGFRC